MNSKIKGEIRNIRAAIDETGKSLVAAENGTDNDNMSLRNAVKDVLSAYYDDGNGITSGYERICRALFIIASNPKNKNAVNAFRAIMILSGEAKLPFETGDEFSKLDLLLAEMRETAFKDHGNAENNNGNEV